MHLQNSRFEKRQPVERDYTAWLALRIASESAMKSGKTTPKDLKAYMLSDQFEVAGFKGQGMNFRNWDHQLRQPILLGGAPRSRLHLAAGRLPAPEFLTDTLGFDEPETKCKF